MNNKIYLESGRKEFTTFLQEKNIKFEYCANDSLDAPTWINLISAGLSLLNILLEFKKWYIEKNKHDTVIININQKITININSDSEEIIKQKIESLKQ